MSSDITVSVGDKGYNLDFDVQKSDGSVYDLTDYTVTLKVWYKYSSGTLLMSGACSIDDAPNGDCHYTLQAGDFDVVGDFLWELELTKTGVIESTRYGTLRVEESA